MISVKDKAIAEYIAQYNITLSPCDCWFCKQEPAGTENWCASRWDYERQCPQSCHAANKIKALNLIARWMGLPSLVIPEEVMNNPDSADVLAALISNLISRLDNIEQTVAVEKSFREDLYMAHNGHTDDISKLERNVKKIEEKFSSIDVRVTSLGEQHGNTQNIAVEARDGADSYARRLEKRIEELERGQKDLFSDVDKLNQRFGVITNKYHDLERQDRLIALKDDELNVRVRALEKALLARDIKGNENDLD
jgi:hypothetical protein